MNLLLRRREMMGIVSDSGGGIPIGVNFYDEVERKTGWHDQRGLIIGKTFAALWADAKTGSRTVTGLMPYDTGMQFQASGLSSVGNVLAVIAFDEDGIAIGTADFTDITNIQQAVLSAEQSSGKKCSFVSCTFESSNPVWMRIS